MFVFIHKNSLGAGPKSVGTVHKFCRFSSWAPIPGSGTKLIVGLFWRRPIVATVNWTYLWPIYSARIKNLQQWFDVKWYKRFVISVELFATSLKRSPQWETSPEKDSSHLLRKKFASVVICHQNVMRQTEAFPRLRFISEKAQHMCNVPTRRLWLAVSPVYQTPTVDDHSAP